MNRRDPEINLSTEVVNLTNKKKTYEIMILSS